MGFVNFVDGVRKLTAAPVFLPMDQTIVAFNDAAVTFYHGRYLLALVWMDQEHDFVVSQRTTPCGLMPAGLNGYRLDKEDGDFRRS